MITVGKNNLDLKQIAESGQCFRWQKLDKAGNKYSIVANGLYDIYAGRRGIWVFWKNQHNKRRNRRTPDRNRA